MSRTARAETPNRLINELLEHFNLPSDRQLAAKIGVSSSEICRLRQGIQDIGASFILVVHDITGWPINDIRRLAGIQVCASSHAVAPA
jgi:hypothetical protein